MSVVSWLSIIGSKVVRPGMEPCCPECKRSSSTARVTSLCPHITFSIKLKSASNRCIICSLCIFGRPGSFRSWSRLLLHTIVVLWFRYLERYLEKESGNAIILDPESALYSDLGGDLMVTWWLIRSIWRIPFWHLVLLCLCRSLLLFWHFWVLQKMRGTLSCKGHPRARTMEWNPPGEMLRSGRYLRM